MGLNIRQLKTSITFISDRFVSWLGGWSCSVGNAHSVAKNNAVVARAFFRIVEASHTREENNSCKHFVDRHERLYFPLKYDYLKHFNDFLVRCCTPGQKSPTVASHLIKKRSSKHL